MKEKQKKNIRLKAAFYILDIFYLERPNLDVLPKGF